MSMKTAAAYIRVSTDDQIEYSPDSQLKALRDYAKRNDMILPEEFIYIDEGISGRTTSKRPAFNRMIGTAKSKPKPFDVILLWKFSRFARNVPAHFASAATEARDGGAATARRG